MRLLVFLFLLTGSVFAQSNWQYNVSWTPVPGKVTLVWLNAPAGVEPIKVLGDATVGNAVVVVPPTGVWRLRVIVTPTTGLGEKAVVQFGPGQQATVTKEATLL